MLGRNGEIKRRINTFRRSDGAGARDQEPAILQVSIVSARCRALQVLCVGRRTNPADQVIWFLTWSRHYSFQRRGPFVPSVGQGFVQLPAALNRSPLR